MTRYAIDAHTALRIVREGTKVHPSHQLVAPNLLRSEALAMVYRDVRAGSTAADGQASELLDGITTMKIRSLGDRVSRATAFRIARELDLPEVGRAEYLSVAKLQADALVAGDPELARLADGVVPLAEFEALSRA